MDVVFHALAHGARRDMIGRLADGDLTVGELAEPLTMSPAAEPLASASAWLRFYERHWEERLDALEALLRPDPTPNEEDR
jgi:hypothetical protein